MFTQVLIKKCVNVLMTLALFTQAWLTASAVMATPASAATANDAPIGLSANDWEDIHTQIRADLNQQAYLKASNTDNTDKFGFSVAISGDTIVIGASEEYSDGSSEDNNDASFAGAAYVFVRSGNTWVQQAYLKAFNADQGDRFGNSVAISGDTIIVGAHQEDSDATGVDGADNDYAEKAGAAYIFVRSGTSWTQQAYLKASNSDSNDRFGSSVAISGETVIIGAPLEDSNGSGQENDDLTNSGAAYIFTRSGSIWSQQAYLKSADPGIDYGFGSSVGISGDWVVVGTPYYNGREPHETDIGAAYIFNRSGSSWDQHSRRIAYYRDGYENFGRSVGISGNTIIVGAVQDDGNQDGVIDGSFNGAGAAYVYVYNGTSWALQAYLKASNLEAEDYFGKSVAISGDIIVVGASGEDSDGTSQGNNAISSAGAAYIFTRDGATWTQQAYLKAHNPDESDTFGATVSVSDGTVVVGAPFEDSSSTGVNGPDNNDASNAGAAYVFNEGSATLEVFLPLIMR
jgi:drug/metabolite transporter superfamily protein YnfA